MIYKIDPLADQVDKEIPADLVGGRRPGGKYAIAVGENAVWAISSNNELRATGETLTTSSRGCLATSARPSAAT